MNERPQEDLSQEDSSSEGFSLRELAERLDTQGVACEVRGDADLRLCGVSTLEAAQSDELAFLIRSGFREKAAASRAGALLVAAEAVDDAPETAALLVIEQGAELALARIVEILYPRRRPLPGVHTTAVVGDDCEIGEGVYVGPYAVLGQGVRVGENAEIHAHVVIGDDCEIGAESLLHPHAVLYAATSLGARTIVHSGAVLGADGFGYATHQGVHHKIPQVGRTVIEDDVEVGALSAVDRAAFEQTRIGAGSKIDNLVQVGHNVVTGRGCILCGQAGVAGSTEMGDYVVLGGQAGAVGHLRLGTGVQVAAKAAVLQSVDGGQVGGIPAVDLKRWRRQTVGVARLDETVKRLRRLEKRLQELEERAAAEETPTEQASE